MLGPNQLRVRDFNRDRPAAITTQPTSQTATNVSQSLSMWWLSGTLIIVGKQRSSTLADGGDFSGTTTGEPERSCDIAGRSWDLYSNLTNLRAPSPVRVPH